jgi:16S rRNA (cytosine967-C5)-methyltransferase
MQTYFRARKFIGSKDRKFVADGLYTLLRHFARLTWWAEKTGMKQDGRHFALLWLVAGTGKKLSEVFEIFDGAGYAPEALSRFEKETLEKVERADFMPGDMPEHVRYECPEWAYKGLQTQFGDDFEKEMTALQDEAPLDLRVNTLKAERETVLKQLRRDEFDIAPTPFAPTGMRVIGRPPFSMHPLYKNGSIEVQDEGSQLLSLLCGVKPGEWVVDFCAGAGGKTMALAAQMQNKGRLYACDVEENRLENSRKRLRRAGVHCVEMKLLDDEEDDWVKKHAGKADCVLIDAPCSGIGTWRRNPFSRWQDMGPSLKQLVTLQANILRSASRLVKSGGRLVYATCSLLPEENQLQVEAFLKQQAGFESLMFDANPLADIQNLDLSVSSLQLTPARHQTDGFFVAQMKRR